MIKKRPEIHERILTGARLLEVDSRFKPMPRWQKFIVFLVFYTFGCFFLVSIFRINAHIPVWLLVGGILSIIALLVFSHCLVMFGHERKKQLIITDIGLTISPYRCATWEEIDRWHFITIRGLMRATLSHAGEGTTFCIYLKKNKFIFGGPGLNSYFAYQGYFLSDEQQTAWRRICTERNVLESDNFPIF